MTTSYTTRPTEPKLSRRLRNMNPEEREAEALEKLRKSTAAAATLVRLGLCLGRLNHSLISPLKNGALAEQHARIIEAGRRPLMSLTIPDDFLCAPRGLGYVVDEKLLDCFAKICHKHYGIPESELDEPQLVIMGKKALSARLKLRNFIDYRTAARQLPINQSNVELIILLFETKRWRELSVRPAQCKIDKINEALEREPEWFFLDR